MVRSTLNIQAPFTLRRVCPQQSHQSQTVTLLQRKLVLKLLTADQAAARMKHLMTAHMELPAGLPCRTALQDNKYQLARCKELAMNCTHKVLGVLDMQAPSQISGYMVSTSSLDDPAASDFCTYTVVC